MPVRVGVLYSVHFNSLGQHFSEAEIEFSPLQRQIIPVACLPTLIHNFDGIYSVNSAKAFYFPVNLLWMLLIFPHP